MNFETVVGIFMVGGIIALFLFFLVMPPYKEKDDTGKIFYVPIGYSRETCDDVIMKMASKLENRSIGKDRDNVTVYLVLHRNFKKENLDFDAECNFDYIWNHQDGGVVLFYSPWTYEEMLKTDFIADNLYRDYVKKKFGTYSKGTVSDI